MILHSHYYDFDQFSSLISTYTNYFSIFSSNIQSMNAKFDELQVYIEVLNHKLRFKYSIICLQETWQSENDDPSLFHLEGYTCISQEKHCSKNRGGGGGGGGGGSPYIYIDNKYTSELHLNINHHDTWEGLVVKVHGGGLLTPIYIYNLYRPPRSSN